MLLQFLLIILGLCSFHTTTAETNFWGNHVCFSSSDCSALQECNIHFGCVGSFWKQLLVGFSVFLVVGGIILFVGIRRCRTHRRNRMGVVIQSTTIIRQPPPSYNFNNPYPNASAPSNPYQHSNQHTISHTHPSQSQHFEEANANLGWRNNAFVPEDLPPPYSQNENKFNHQSVSPNATRY